MNQLGRESPKGTRAPDLLGKGALLVLVPLMVAPVLLVFGAGMLIWNLIVAPSRLPWSVWVSVGTIFVGMVLLVTRKYVRDDSRFARVMDSTEKGRFYRLAVVIGLCVLAVGMLVGSSTLFVIAFAIWMGALVIDALFRTVRSSAER
jgi:hypothetical protein